MWKKMEKKPSARIFGLVEYSGGSLIETPGNKICTQSSQSGNVPQPLVHQKQNGKKI
jgi:hypothetical protein